MFSVYENLGYADLPKNQFTIGIVDDVTLLLFLKKKKLY
jgi:hypothetical protein